MEVVIIAIIYALLPTIISLLTSAATHAMLVIMDDRLFNLNGNVLTALEQTLFGDLKIETDIAGVIYAIGMSFIFINMLLQIISSYISSLQGEPAENPIRIFIRGVVTVSLMVIIFGAPSSINSDTFLLSNGLLGYFGNLMSKMISYIDVSNINAREPISFSMIANPAEHIVLIVFAFALFKGTVEAGIVFVERWLSFAFNVMFGPIFVSFNASRSTQETFKNWLMSLVTQALALLVSYVIIAVYFASFSKLNGINVGGDLTSSILFAYATSIALLSLYKNSEKLLNAVGLRTIANTNSLKEYSQGMRAAGGLWRATGGQISMMLGREMGRKVAENVTHGTYTSLRNRLGENNPFTRNAKFVDTKNSADTIKPNSKVSVDKNGKYSSESKRFSNSAAQVNSAISKGAGAPISMKDVSNVNGLNKLSDFKTGSTAVVGTLDKEVMGADGKVSTEKISGQVFRGSKARSNGTAEAPKTYAIVPDDNMLKPGTSITVGTDKYDNKFDYHVSNAPAIDLGEGKGYMYEISEAPLSKTEFEVNTELSNKYANDYSTYRAAYDSWNNSTIAKMEADGFDYSWKESASDSIQKSMFGSSPLNKKDNIVPDSRYQNLDVIFKKESEERKIAIQADNDVAQIKTETNVAMENAMFEKGIEQTSNNNFSKNSYSKKNKRRKNK